MLAPESVLPALRDDLEYIQGRDKNKGDEIYRIYDPARHQYFHLDRTTYQIMNCWRSERAGIVISRCESTYGFAPEIQQIEQILEYLNKLNLLTRNNDSQLQRSAGGPSVGKLFTQLVVFRINILNPQPALTYMRALTPILFSRVFWSLCAIVAIAIGYLLLPRMPDYLATLDRLQFAEMATYFFLALVITKIVHEAGHAIAATHYGCAVPSFGVLFVAFFPLPFVDVTDAWRLPSRYQRAAISSGGFMAELVLAILANLLWIFLADGAIRDLLFFIGSVSLISSLLFNLNPLMKFDGYFVLTDLLPFSNLSTRSTAIGRWLMREFLLDIRARSPDTVSPRVQIYCAIFSYCCWIYRFFLYFAIALLMYHMAFKLLGIILFLAELWYFIARPVINEFKCLIEMRHIILSRPRLWVTLMVATFLAVLAALPVSCSTTAPAVFEPERQAVIYAGDPAIIAGIHVREGQHVSSGDILFELHQPDLAWQLDQARIRARLIDLRLARIVSDHGDLEQRLVLERQLSSQREHIATLLELQDNLVLRAPFAGTIRSLEPDVSINQWVHQDLQLARVVVPGQGRVRASLEETSVDRIDLQANAKFIPDDPTVAAISVALGEILRSAGERERQDDLLTQIQGPGAPAIDPATTQTALQVGRFVAHFVPDGETAIDRTLKGTIRIKAQPESLMTRIVRRVAAILILESGF